MVEREIREGKCILSRIKPSHSSNTATVINQETSTTTLLQKEEAEEKRYFQQPCCEAWIVNHGRHCETSWMEEIKFKPLSLFLMEL